MSDLISRGTDYEDGFADGYNAGIMDTEPQKGKWKKVIDEPWCWFECSECGRKPLFNQWGTQRYFSTFAVMFVLWCFALSIN